LYARIQDSFLKIDFNFRLYRHFACHSLCRNVFVN